VTSATQGFQVGLAHLTLLHLTPPELVATAAEAGYDFVSLRVRPVTEGEHRHPMTPGSAMSRETIRQLEETGLPCNDVEVMLIKPGIGREDWLPALEAGAALGAQALVCSHGYPDWDRFRATLAALVEDASSYGIRPALEPVSYFPISRVSQAAELAAATGAGVLLDTLHVFRGGSGLEEVRGLDPNLISFVQICDAPRETPAKLDIPESLPLGMTTDGSVLQVEARALRKVPGHGGLPLSEFLALLPAGTRITIESPAADVQAGMSDLEFARLNLHAVRKVLDEASEQAETDLTARGSLSTTTRPADDRSSTT